MMKDYVQIARQADALAEQICRECGVQRSPGNTIAVNYTQLYPQIFAQIFDDLLRNV